MRFLTRFPALSVFASIALFVAGGGTVVYGFSTLGYDLPLAATVIPLAIGAGLIACSVMLVVATERQLRRDEAEQKALAPAAPARRAAKGPRRDPAAIVQADRVLARWTLAPDEWRAFNEVEAEARKRGGMYNTAVGALFGAVAPWVVTGQWRYSAAGALLMAAVVLVWTMMSAARLRKREPRAGGSVVVRRNAVEIDGVTETLRDGTWWLSSAKLRDDLALPVLELSVKKTAYERGGSSRTMEQVVRVPAPRDRAARAAKVAEQLRLGIPDVDDDA
ncbi:MAG TPA: hypothetical protein VEX86_21740 [Longimicrobium sp.]|nr:hypothetical protein [Longimicrobium sp.]